MEIKKRKQILLIVFVFLFIFELVTFYQMMGVEKIKIYTIIVEALSIVASIIMFLFIVSIKSDTDEKIKDAEAALEVSNERFSKQEEEVAMLNEALDKKTEFVNKVSDFLVRVQEATDLSSLGNDVVQSLAKSMDACQGVFYKVDNLKKPTEFQLAGSFAFHSEEGKTVSYQDGLIGQAAAEKRIQIYDEVPEDHIDVVSGLGNSSKVNLVLVPIVNSGTTIGMIELASFHVYSDDDKSFLEHVASSLGTKMLTLK